MFRVFHCAIYVSHNPDIMTTDILRATKAQMDMMVSVMEQNSGKIRSLKFWTKLSNRLNSIGPPMRSATQWRKGWHCLTSEVRRKCQKPAKTMKLTPNQAKVARLMRYRVPEWRRKSSDHLERLSEASEEEISQDILEDTSEDTPIQHNTGVSSTQNSEESPPDVKMQSIVESQERFLQIMENLTTVISGKLEELVQIEREKLELMRKK